MTEIYNIAMVVVAWLCGLVARLTGDGKQTKFALFVKGRQGLVERIRKEMAGERKGPTIWIHAASMGEFAVARPLIARLKREGTCTVVVTFFSPSGYEALRRRPLPSIDHLFYLPWDTRRNAAAFIEAVRPDKALFIISEYWPNYLVELRRRRIPLYLVSALIRRDAPFFRWYGGLFRRTLDCFTRIFVLDEASKANLAELGYDRATVSGDPLFDNAALVARTPWHDPLVERFADGQALFIAGSISDDADLELVATLADRHRDRRFLFVPHDIDAATLDAIDRALGGRSLRYSACDAHTDFSATQVLVIDFVGALAYLYRYGAFAYVGGGFTPYLHSVIEATVYGLPVAFGPCIHRKVTPNQLIELGIGQVVRRPDDLESWYTALAADPSEGSRLRQRAADYVARNVGATERIAAAVEEGLRPAARPSADLTDRNRKNTTI